MDSSLGMAGHMMATQAVDPPSALRIEPLYVWHRSWFWHAGSDTNSEGVSQVQFQCGPESNVH